MENQKKTVQGSVKFAQQEPFLVEIVNIFGLYITILDELFQLEVELAQNAVVVG